MMKTRVVRCGFDVAGSCSARVRQDLQECLFGCLQRQDISVWGRHSGPP